MTGRSVICIAPTEWDGAWQRYHEIMRRLAQSGNAVLVVDHLYRLLPVLPRSAAGASRTLRKVWRMVGAMRMTPRRVLPGIALLAPPVLPGRLAPLTWPLLRRALGRSLDVLGMRAPVLWCAFPTPYLDHIARAVHPALTVYDCASAFADDPQVPRAVVRAEQMLLQRADLVFTDSRMLWERHRAVHPRCHWIATGVDAGRFASVRVQAPRWRQPVVGYIGTLHAWLDAELIAAVARARPQWRFVFAGPRRERAKLAEIESLPNVELLGPLPHEVLPELVAHFSLGWIPYRVTAFTRHVFPTKMLEYLAAGKPVVSTDLPEVRAFAPPVRIASGPTALLAALDEAVADRGGEMHHDLARRYDWSVQMAAVHQYLDEALSEHQ